MLEKKIKLNRKRPWNCENFLQGSNSFTGSGNPEEVKAVPLLGCWFGLQINYKFIINYEALPLALLSCGLRKRQILKSSEPISILFLASQSHKRSYLQLGDLVFYIPFMYRLISWCSDLWHLNRKDAYKKQTQSRRDPNALPGPRQGQSKKGVYAQQPLLLLCPRKWENGSSPCPWGKEDMARVSGVGSHTLPGCPAEVGAHGLVPPSCIHLQLGSEGLLLHGTNLMH